MSQSQTKKDALNSKIFNLLVLLKPKDKIPVLGLDIVERQS